VPDPGGHLVTDLPDPEQWIKLNVLILPSQDNTELSEDDDQKTNKGQEVEELGKTPVSVVPIYVLARRRTSFKLDLNYSEHFHGSIQLHISVVYLLFISTSSYRFIRICVSLCAGISEYCFVHHSVSPYACLMYAFFKISFFYLYLYF